MVITLQSNGNEQDMPFQSEGGCTLDFFINVQVIMPKKNMCINQ
jgi:hypothetical protein